jgi:hypothetical protein
MNLNYGWNGTALWGQDDLSNRHSAQATRPEAISRKTPSKTICKSECSGQGLLNYYYIPKKTAARNVLRKSKSGKFITCGESRRFPASPVGGCREQSEKGGWRGRGGSYPGSPSRPPRHSCRWHRPPRTLKQTTILI